MRKTLIMLGVVVALSARSDIPLADLVEIPVCQTIGQIAPITVPSCNPLLIYSYNPMIAAMPSVLASSQIAFTPPVYSIMPVVSRMDAEVADYLSVQQGSRTEATVPNYLAAVSGSRTEATVPNYWAAVSWVRTEATIPNYLAAVSWIRTEATIPNYLAAVTGVRTEATVPNYLAAVSGSRTEAAIPDYATVQPYGGYRFGGVYASITSGNQTIVRGQNYAVLGSIDAVSPDIFLGLDFAPKGHYILSGKYADLAREAHKAGDNAAYANYVTKYLEMVEIGKAREQMPERK